MKMNKRILVVEDDPSIRLGLDEVLKGESFEVFTCERGDLALASCEKFKPNLIILDVMLPGMSGYDICKALRKRNVSCPILMLTAKGQEIDKVLGLDLGADDYVTKPFGVRELLARIHALLRRGPASTDPKNEEIFSIGESIINPKTFQLTRKKTTHPLTPRELKLLQFLYQNRNVVLSRDKLLNEVWGYEYYGTTRTLDQAVVKLRKKLDIDKDDNTLESVHGVGYRLNLEEAKN